VIELNQAAISRNKQKLNEFSVVLMAGIGLFLSTLDSGIMNIALPTLARTFNSSLATMAWTVTLYSLSLTGTIIVFGRLSDKVGRLKIYAWGLTVFSVASALCGLSHTSGQLIAFRALQGLGAAMLQATSAAIITTSIPIESRGAALGKLAVLMGLGPVLGPSIGGFCLSFGGWSWIFWINLPIALMGLLGCRSLAGKLIEVPNSIQLNASGNLLLSFSVLCLLLGFFMWPSSGIAGASTYVPLAVAAVLLFGFLTNELRVKSPILDLRLFQNGEFTASILAIFIFGGATSIGFIVPPYFLEQVSHLSPWQVGLVNLSAPSGLVLLSSSSGRLTNKWGNTRLMFLGLLAMFMSYAVLTCMQSNWGPWGIAALMFLYGMGGGLFLTPNMKAIMGAVGKEMQGTIGAVQRMVQNLGIAVYTSIAADLIPVHSPTGVTGLMTGLRHSWGFAAISILASILVFLCFRVRRK
jgi:EmrB/QacA subfamily drug resistance transporter